MSMTRKELRGFAYVASAIGLPLIICFVSMSLDATAGTAQLADDAVIASVGETEIKYYQIKVSIEKARQQFERKHGRSPQSEDEDDILSEQSQQVLSNLRKSISVIVRDHQAQIFGVSVTQQDIADFENKNKHDNDPQHVIDAKQRKQQLLVDALERVYDKGEDSKAVFQAYLAKDFIEVEWEAALRQFAKPAMREWLVETTAGRATTVPKDKRAIQAFVLEEKMKKVIESELIRTDPEFAEYVRLITNDPTTPKLRNFGPSYREAKRDEWWKHRYIEANIVIKDDRFKEALSNFRE